MLELDLSIEEIESLLNFFNSDEVLVLEDEMI